jgi:hypothetical protein
MEKNINLNQNNNPMRKFVFTIFAVLLCTVTSYSQLSQRESEATTIKLGTRPTTGDMALTFGVDIGQGGVADLPILNQLTSGDILTFRRYLSPSKVMRLGVRLYKDSESIKGDRTNIITDDADGKIQTKNSSSEYILVPGMEKHFNKSNIFDVYVGSDLYVGYRRDKSVNNEEYANGNYDNFKSTSSGLILGLGGVVGFNIFVAQLPVSLGLEYGLNMKWSFEGKTKVMNESKVGGVSTTQKYYTSDRVAGTFSKLHQREFGMDTNNNVRILLNIYFGK